MSAAPFAPLVSTQWLADHLADDDLVVFDASYHLPGARRDARADYLAGHIPGARFFDSAALVDRASPVPQALPTPKQLARHLARLGATPDNRLVFYDDSALRSAARAWFLCRAHGLPNVAVLDGGLKKWKAEGRALESGERPIEPARPFTLPQPRAIRSKADMLANLESGREQIVDARDPARFRGDIEDKVHGLPGGHIPTARNLHFALLFDERGCLRPPEELEKLFAEAGVDLDAPIVASCGSGVTACTLLLALDTLGFEGGALYDGSWLEWGADPDTPKEKGPGRMETP